MKYLLTILTIGSILLLSHSQLHAKTTDNYDKIDEYTDKLDCQNPDLLTPQLREAYYELLEIAEQIEGMEVSIRCREFVFEDKNE